MRSSEYKNYEIRPIKPEEGEAIVTIEHTCFAPGIAETREALLERVSKAPDLFIVAVEKNAESYDGKLHPGKVVGYLNGVSTDEEKFRDEFFLDINLYKTSGRNIMLLGLAVLPEYQGQGLARAIMEYYQSYQKAEGRKKLFLTCLEGKVEMYKRMNFIDLGIAESSWGSQVWHEMVCRL